MNQIDYFRVINNFSFFVSFCFAAASDDRNKKKELTHVSLGIADLGACGVREGHEAVKLRRLLLRKTPAAAEEAPLAGERGAELSDLLVHEEPVEVHAQALLRLDWFIIKCPNEFQISGVRGNRSGECFHVTKEERKNIHEMVG